MTGLKRVNFCRKTKWTTKTDKKETKTPVTLL